MRRHLSVAVLLACAACTRSYLYREGSPRQWLPGELRRSVTGVWVNINSGEPRPIQPTRRNAYVKDCKGGVDVGGYAEIRFGRVSVRSDQEGVWLNATDENGILFQVHSPATSNDWRAAGNKASPPPLGWTRLPEGTSLRQWSYPTLLITTDSDSATARIAKGFQELAVECALAK